MALESSKDRGHSLDLPLPIAAAPSSPRSLFAPSRPMPRRSTFPEGTQVKTQVGTDFAGLPVSARLCEIYLPKAPGTRPCPVPPPEEPPEEPHPLLMG